MKIIVGLGNPGLRYKNTKHNIGFRVLDTFAKRHRCSIKRKAFKGIYGVCRVAGQEVLLFKPLTFVNLSGEAVEAVCASRLSDPKDLLVVSDDLNLPFGRIRLRGKGSSGGHKGLDSIVGKIGRDFARLRVGIKLNGTPEDMAAYVLSPFPRKVRSGLNDVLDQAAGCIELWLGEGTKKAMSRHNR